MPSITRLKNNRSTALINIHLFVINAGKMSRMLAVIPGYLPLKLNIIQSMTSGADLATYISHLRQDAADYSIVHNFNDPRGIIRPRIMTLYHHRHHHHHRIA